MGVFGKQGRQAVDIKARGLDVGGRWLGVVGRRRPSMASSPIAGNGAFYDVEQYNRTEITMSVMGRVAPMAEAT